MRILCQTGLCLLILASAASCERYGQFPSDQLGTPFSPTDSTASKEIPIYTYEIVNAYPHDSSSFTQGLVFHNGFFYEGTGQSPYFGQGHSGNGLSTLRKVTVETGEILQSISLDRQYFGEGIAILGDEIVQLTWVSQIGFVYDLATFQLKRKFVYQTEGWGITHDGARFIMSDGTASLYFRESQSLNQVARSEVRDNRGLVWRLNELEFIKGEIYANVWQTDLIARIQPITGRVLGWIDLAGINGDDRPHDPDAVLNGIAYDPKADRLFVTGKLWPKVYEIRIKPKE